LRQDRVLNGRRRKMERSMSRYVLAICALGVFQGALLGASSARTADDDLELAFNDHCRECHSFVKGQNRLGPSLYGVIGRKAGTLPGYGFTDSLKDSGVTWNAATLDKWIADPGAVIPGNGMSPP
jgi:cytochrome c